MEIEIQSCRTTTSAVFPSSLQYSIVVLCVLVRVLRDVVSPKFPAFSRVNRHSPPSLSFFLPLSSRYNREVSTSASRVFRARPLEFSTTFGRVVENSTTCHALHERFCYPPSLSLSFSDRDRVRVTPLVLVFRNDFLPVSICVVVLGENRGKVCSHSRFRRKWGNYVGVTKGLLTQWGSGDGVLLV